MIVIVIEGHSSEAEIDFLELWRRRWNVQRVGPPIGSMDEVILDCGGHAQDFIIYVITYAISTCIVGNANGTYQSRVVKYLRNIDEIKNTQLVWIYTKVSK